jgi:hypothetical protein
MRRHYLQHEAKAEENTAAPPAYGGEKVPGLPDADQGVRRGTRSAKAGSQPTALSGLEQNSETENDAVNDEQSEKKRVNH